LIAAAAILIVSILQMKQNHAANNGKGNVNVVAESFSSRNNNNNIDFDMDMDISSTGASMPSSSIFHVPVAAPSLEPFPPTYMPPPDSDESDDEKNNDEKNNDDSATGASTSINLTAISLPPSLSPSTPVTIVVVVDNDDIGDSDGDEDIDDIGDDTLTTALPATASPTFETETTQSPSASPSIGTDGPTWIIEDFENFNVSNSNSSVANNNNNNNEKAAQAAFNSDQTKIGTDLKFIVANKSPKSLPYLEDAESAQYKAFAWMTKDPGYWNMTIDTIVQRWTLGVLYHSTGGPNWKTEQLPNVYASGKQPWMSYSDECQWESSNEGYQGRICDDNNNYFAIHLRNAGLVGSIPGELGLLSKYMRLLFFNSNELTGTLPSELGQLTKLVKLNIQYNDISGSIPMEVGNWGELTIAAMGNNQFTGTIPSEMGLWKSVLTIGLENNYLNGTLPEELAYMENIEKLSIEKNSFSGTIPDSMNYMYQLTSLSLQNNDLIGKMPWGLCPDCYSMEELKADCEEIKCKCCTVCFDDPSEQ